MHRCQSKNTINDSQGNMAPPEPSYSITASPGYSNTAEAQDNFKTDFMTKVICKEEINKSLLKDQEKTIEGNK